jgi:hypothetical protein
LGEGRRFLPGFSPVFPQVCNLNKAAPKSFGALDCHPIVTDLRLKFHLGHLRLIPAGDGGRSERDGESFKRVLADADERQPVGSDERSEHEPEWFCLQGNWTLTAQVHGSGQPK